MTTTPSNQSPDWKADLDRDEAETDRRIQLQRRDPEAVTILAWYLADNGQDAKIVAHAVEKPWKYEEEYKAALEELAGEQ